MRTRTKTGKPDMWRSGNRHPSSGISRIGRDGCAVRGQKKCDHKNLKSNSAANVQLLVQRYNKIIVWDERKPIVTDASRSNNNMILHPEQNEVLIPRKWTEV
jgi:hypothetical protein